VPEVSRFFGIVIPNAVRGSSPAARVGLKLMHIREITLTNPVYRRRLHRGETARTGRWLRSATCLANRALIPVGRYR
jgi:hypothetical protein